MKSFASSTDRKPETIKDLIPSRIRWEELKTPMTPSEVISLFGETIPLWEQREMENYSEIYFIGKNFKPKDPEFHDEQGDYKVLIKDHIGFRYEVVGLIGKGSFGQVLEVLDHKLKKSIALKVVKNLPKFHQQAKIEVEILKFIKEFDTCRSSNIIEIIDSFTFRSHIVRVT
jgi:dual specificity tyrosine-phosphorylation-regulated kinase 2/3/4